jgi:DNA-binding response OmpR family regulator
MRALMSTILYAFGVKSNREASSGEDAWRWLAENHCDVIFLDWVMEGMTGLAFTRKLRTEADSPNRFVPIVMLTGHSSRERVQAARDAGVTEFLTKPVAANTVLARLTAVIENPRPFVRTNAYFGPCRRRRRPEEYGGDERRIGESGFEIIDVPTSQ